MRSHRRTPRGARLRIASLAALVATGSFAVAATSPVAHSEDPTLAPAPERIYVIVVDGLMPQDVTTEQMPTLAALKAQSTWYEEARAAFVTETLPNHAAMMSGVTPARNGIVGNKQWKAGDSATGGSYPNSGSWRADTLVTRLERACGPGVNTATILSKQYLFYAFAGGRESDPNQQLEADYHPVPEPFIPVSDHAPDAVMMNFLNPWVKETPTPQFALVNLGDVDRSGHADEGGNTVIDHDEETYGDNPQADPGATRGNEFQKSSMLDTDTLLSQFFQTLVDEGWWDDSVIVLLSDHGMNWATQEKWIDTPGALSGGVRRGTPGAGTQRLDGTGLYNNVTDFVVVNNGAADQVYIREENTAERKNMVWAMRNIPGVERVIADPADFANSGNTTQRSGGPAPLHPRADYGLDDELAGDAILLAAPGWSFNPAENTSTNPVPGVHGHTVTQHNTLMVTGGHPSLGPATEVPGASVWPIGPSGAPLPANGGAGVMSVAPTIAALTGLGEIPGLYDGKQLTEAFDPGALGSSQPFCPGIEPPAPAGGGDPGGDGGDGGTDGGDPGQVVNGPVTRGRAAASLVSSTRTASYKRPFALSGRVSATGCTKPDWVEVRRRLPGAKEFVEWAEFPVKGDDGWKATVSAERNASYVAVPDATRCGVSLSAPVAVPVRPEIRVTAVRSCGKGGAALGTVRPGGRGAKVLLQRRTGSRWRTLARDRLDGKSRFKLVPRSCRAGKHRVLWPQQDNSNVAGARRFRR